MAFMERSSRGLSERLRRASEELRALEMLLSSAGDIDPRLLLEFREAVNYVRHTAWATQVALDEKREKGDAPGVLPLLVAERVRITSNLARTLATDLEGNQATRETRGMGALAENVDRLWRRLQELYSVR